MKSAFGVVHKAYVGGGVYLPITEAGVKDAVKAVRAKGGNQIPSHGITRADKKTRKKTLKTMQRINAIADNAETVKLPKKHQKVISDVTGGMKVRPIRMTKKKVKVPKNPLKPEKGLKSFSTKDVVRSGSAATDLGREPLIIVPKKKKRKYEIKGVRRESMGLDPVSRTDVVAHEAAHLTQTPKRMRGPDRQARRVYRNTKLEGRKIDVEEPRADIVASRARGRTIRSGHVNERHYWDSRHKLERRMKAPLTPKFTRSVPKYKMMSLYTDKEIKASRKAVRENRPFVHLDERGIPVDHRPVFDTDTRVVSRRKLSPKLEEAVMRARTPGRTFPYYTYKDANRLKWDVSRAKELTSKERARANKKYERIARRRDKQRAQQLRAKHPEVR